MSLAVRCLGGSVDDVVSVEVGEAVVDEFKSLLANVVGDGRFREDWTCSKMD
jgi:hypothetical protein